MSTRISPSASCLDVVASVTTEMVVVTPIPGQSLSPFSLRMRRGPSRLSVDTSDDYQFSNK